MCDSNSGIFILVDVFGLIFKELLTSLVCLPPLTSVPSILRGMFTFFGSVLLTLYLYKNKNTHKDHAKVLIMV